MTKNEASTLMGDKPHLQVVDGDHAQLERNIFNLLVSPDWAKYETEIDRLRAILRRRGDLSLIRGGLNDSPDNDNIEQGDKE